MPAAITLANRDPQNAPPPLEKYVSGFLHGQVEGRDIERMLLPSGL